MAHRLRPSETTSLRALSQFSDPLRNLGSKAAEKPDQIRLSPRFSLGPRLRPSETTSLRALSQFSDPLRNLGSKAAEKPDQIRLSPRFSLGP